MRLFAEPGAATSVNARAAGIREALLLRSVPLPRELRIEGDPTDPQFIRKSVRGRGIDTMICANDYTAARLLKTLGQVGVSVPQDLRLIGFDDARYATWVAVSLTIHQSSRDIATFAFRALEARIHDAALPTGTMLLDPRLVIRDSCGPYAKSMQESTKRTPRRKQRVERNVTNTVRPCQRPDKADPPT